MYIIIAGGGKVGRSLTETLVNDGHEVLLIEKNPAKVEQYTEQLGGVVVQGDACEMQVLTDAGAGRADVVIAVTGDDEDNLVCCQICKRKFGVNRVIARVNNHKNARIFRALGIDSAVSHTKALLEAINQELPTSTLRHLGLLRDGQQEIISTLVGPESPVLGKNLGTLKLPVGSTILLLMRNGQRQDLQANTTIKANDELVLLTPHDNDAELHQILVGS